MPVECLGQSSRIKLPVLIGDVGEVPLVDAEAACSKCIATNVRLRRISHMARLSWK